MNGVLVGLNTLAAILGYNSYDTFDFDYEDFVNVSHALNVPLIEENNSYGFENQIAMRDLYTLEGKNKFELIEFENSYVIYDKKEDSVTENKNECSPYTGLTDVLLIFVSPEITDGESLYLYANEKSIYNVQDESNVDNDYINSIANNNAEEAGKYYTFKNYDDAEDLRLIDNAFYFENLRGRHGKNINGTCGVVASQVLLGYYDSFLNDNIIPEEFDETATFRNDITASDVQSPGSGENFHQHLIKYLGNIGITNKGIGMNIYEEKDLICKYLRSRGLDFHERWIEGNWGDACSNKASDTIRETIENNRPIFVGARGHATIAYGCDNNYIYVYDGWGNVKRTPWSTTNTSMFNTNQNPHTVDISGWTSKHSHSDNYYSTLTNMYHCTCGYMWA